MQSQKKTVTYNGYSILITTVRDGANSQEMVKRRDKGLSRKMASMKK